MSEKNKHLHVSVEVWTRRPWFELHCLHGFAVSRSFWPRRFYWRVGGAKSGWRLQISMWSSPQPHPGGSPWQYSLKVMCAHVWMPLPPMLVYMYTCRSIYPCPYPPPHVLISSSLSHCFSMPLSFPSSPYPSHASSPQITLQNTTMLARLTPPSPNLCT